MAKHNSDLHARPPLARMWRIHECIKEGRYPNSKSLARELEVSPRTLKRDIEFMRDRFSLPIEYHPQKYGYYYTKPVDQFLGPLGLSEAEAFALLIAQKAIDQYRGTPFQKPLHDTYQRLIGMLDSQSAVVLANLGESMSIRPFAPGDGDLAKFEILTQALRLRRVLRFHYRNLGEAKLQLRRVRPYHVACVDNQWYLFAHDLDRRAMRTFALPRLKDPEMTPQTFRMPKDFSLEKYLSGSLAVFRGAKDYEVVIEFDRWGGDLIRSRHWHDSQELIDLPGGGLRLRLRLNSIEEAERFALSWGSHATVIRPQHLIKRLHKITTDLGQRYEGSLEEPSETVADTRTGSLL